LRDGRIGQVVSIHALNSAKPSSNTARSVLLHQD